MLVLNDSVSGLVEAAAFCKVGDEKRPSLVGLPDFTTQQVCPEDLSEAAPMLTDAAPDTFYVRIMFDELLDPNVEELIPILDENDQETGSFTGTLINTQPVTLKCTGVDGAMHDVPYDGYYSPSGNNVTWPLGPSLVIKQLGEFVIPTNSECEITLKDFITDKDGNPVPEMQRGPFTFRVSPIKPIFIDPADGSEVDPGALYTDNVFVQFNTGVDPSSFCDDGAAMDECEFEFTPDLGGAAPFPLSLVGFSDAEYVFFPFSPPMENTEYSFQFKEGGIVKDFCGVETTFGAPDAADNTKTTVTTGAFGFRAIAPGNGDVVPSNRKITATFNNVIDPSTLDAGEFSLTPAPTSGGVAQLSAENGFLFFGHYQPDTEYTFTINQGATVADAHGVVHTFAEAETVKFKTQPIAITANSPANGATVTKATPTSPTNIAFVFNQSMNAATWTAEDVELTGTATALAFGASGCTAGGTSCALIAQGTFTPGTYTLKLKAGATIDDVLGNTYTQAADRSITFTVREATPPPPAIPCLGE